MALVTSATASLFVALLFLSPVSAGRQNEKRNVCDAGTLMTPGLRQLRRNPRRPIIALAAIDNLGKGAADQAVQNANLSLGLDEAAGLQGAPLWP